MTDPIFDPRGLGFLPLRPIRDPWGWQRAHLPGSKDHINISQKDLTNKSFWNAPCLGHWDHECKILMFLWSLGPLHLGLPFFCLGPSRAAGVQKARIAEAGRTEERALHHEHIETRRVEVAKGQIKAITERMQLVWYLPKHRLSSSCPRTVQNRIVAATYFYTPMEERSFRRLTGPCANIHVCMYMYICIYMYIIQRY